MPKPVQFLSYTLLADPQRQPAALWLVPAEPSPAAALPDLTQLGQTWPTVMREDHWASLNAQMRETVAGAGCQIVALASLQTLHALQDQPLPDARWLAGDWYLQAPANPGRQQTGSRQLALKLLQLVATDADTRELEDIFRLEPTLSYNLLRLVNSAGMGSRRRIDSLTQAIVFLGRRQLKRWLNLMLFASQRDDPRSAMLLARAAVRARCCERLAQECGLDHEQQENAFLIGMFSLLDVMFGQPLPALLAPLNLPDDMQAALLAGTGALGQLLQAVRLLEQSPPPAAILPLDMLRPALPGLDAVLIDAYLWMHALVQPSPGDLE